MHHTLMHQVHMHNDQGAYVYTSCIQPHSMPVRVLLLRHAQGTPPLPHRTQMMMIVIMMIIALYTDDDNGHHGDHRITHG